MTHTVLHPSRHRDRGDKDLYCEVLEEHHVVDMVMSEIKKTKADSEEFGAKGKVLKDLVGHHAGEEENEMFLAQAKDSLLSEGGKGSTVGSRL
jgi:hypothetical protein